MSDLLQRPALIREIADQCVRCGLCSQYCPTYKVTQNESESPRGRIAIMRALAMGDLELTDKTQTYLDHCLVCRACETVCPAHLEYGKLIINTRQFISEKKATSSLPKLINYFATSKTLQTYFRYFIFFYQKLGMQSFLEKLKFFNFKKLANYNNYLLKISKPRKWQNYYPPKIAKQGDVALFIGCVTNLLEQEILAKTIKLLSSIGYGVYVPAKQNCCGALHYNHGEMHIAKKLQTINSEVFNNLPIDAIITTASGCGAMLTIDTALKNKVMDVNYFLSIHWPQNIKINSLEMKVALHQPCSLKNGMHQSAAVKEVLQKIPQLEIIELTSQKCCGAAGINFLQHSEMAQKISDDLLHEIEMSRCEVLLTTNIGCRLHLLSKFKNKKIRIMHPIEILYQQTRFAN